MADIDVGKITEALNDKADIDLGNANKELLLFVGMVAPFAGTAAPAGWLKCDGSAISRTTYAALFNVIGTTYGTGDGSTTFNLPTQSVLPLGTSAKVSIYGDGNAMGLRGISQSTNAESENMYLGEGNGALVVKYISPTPSIGESFTTNTAGSIKDNTYVGLSRDVSKSGIVGTADIANATGATAIVCIKY